MLKYRERNSIARNHDARHTDPNAPAARHLVHARAGDRCSRLRAAARQHAQRFATDRRRRTRAQRTPKRAAKPTVFTLGDNAYESGTAKQFRDCYNPTWGRHKARTRPSPGNHDYVTPGAAAYYDYFGESAGPDRHGYYSFELGAWHIVSLNSEIDAGPESAQAQWLAADLAAHPAACTLAYWHKPIFSSGSVHGNDRHMRPIWNILVHAGADVVLNGHDHIYERFAPQTVDGVADPQGMREFIVGVGGAEPYGIGEIQPNSEVRAKGLFGVLKLTLHAASYDWEFVPAKAGAFSDAGNAGCVMAARS